MAQIKSLRTGIKFKDTPIGKVPVDWEVLLLSQVAEIIMGQSPSSQDCHDYEEGLPFYQGNADFGSKFPTTRRWCKKPLKIAQEGDILISVRAPVGEINIAPHECCIGRGLGAIRAAKINSGYLYQSMLFHRKALEKVSQGSTFEAINRKDLSDFLIFAPSVKEQKKIAEILTTVDDAIEETDRIIEKTREMKRGLMQKLLTRGIGHKKFKNTEIGEIPVDWEVTKLRQIGVLKGGNGFPEKFQGHKNKDYFFLKVSDMNLLGNEIYINFSSNTIDKEIQAAIGCNLFPKDTIIFAKVGAALLLNRRRILTSDSCIDNNMMGLIVSKDENYKFYYYIMQTIDFAKFVSSGALPSINQTVLGGIDVIRPPLPEQKEIAEILTTVDEEVTAEEIKKQNLESLKKSLMQVLLTGRVRVKLQ